MNYISSIDLFFHESEILTAVLKLFLKDVQIKNLCLFLNSKPYTHKKKSSLFFFFF